MKGQASTGTRRRPSVAILGGGVGGMSAAHELAERGFRVTVYEAGDVPGGKARSTFVPGSGVGGRRGWPAEHGFRFFPSFYRHLPDTMKRIPFGQNENGVFDNLVGTDRSRVLRTGQAAGDVGWFDMVTHFPLTLEEIYTTTPGAWLRETGIPADDVRYFLRRLLLFSTSCAERRLEEYEDITYWSFIGAEARHPNFGLYFGEVAVQALVGMRPQLASARTTVGIGLQLWLDHFKPGTRVARLLNGPTHDAWLGPWHEYLRQRGVDYRFGARVTSLVLEYGRIAQATLADGTPVVADYYVAALPAERMAELVTPEVVAADPALAGIARLHTAWMGGVQFFLRRDVPVVPGHLILVGAPWGLTCVSQPQFWRAGALSAFGDGRVEGVLSLCIANWDRPGQFVAKPARECTREEIRREVWQQLQVHLAQCDVRLGDEDLVSWYLADSIVHRVDGKVENREPLLINTVGSYWHRPEAATRIRNLMLAADYVRTHTDIATMEAANEAARRAVNAILVDAGISATPCSLWPLEEPEIFAPLRRLDAALFRRRKPHAMAALLAAPAAWRPPVAADAPDSTPLQAPRPATGSVNVAAANVAAADVAAVDVAAAIDVDVLIVGAGPAGSSTALNLVRAGHAWASRVLLVDKAVHPRPKLCGGAVTHLGEKVLRRLGLTVACEHVPVREVRLLYRERVCSFHGNPVMRVTQRDAFDHWLLGCVERAGVTVRQGEAVVAVEPHADHVRVTTERGVIRARVVVAADGSNSTVRQKLGWRDPAHLAQLLEVLTPATGRGADELIRDNVALFEFGGVTGGGSGYYWDFPCRVGGQPAINRGVYRPALSQRDPKRSLKAALSASLAARDLSLADFELQGHPVRTFNPNGPLCASRILLVGDAAGVDPMYGEGISFALAYGEAAAAAITSAFIRGRFDFADYSRRVQAHALLGQLPTRVKLARWGARVQDPRTLGVLWQLGARALEASRWGDRSYVPAADERAWILRA